MTKKWRYEGDVNLECGGTFYKNDLKNWIENDYVEVVAVAPCSDAGGPDNCFWIERNTVIRKKDTVSVFGFSWDEDLLISSSGDVLDNPELVLQEACFAYGSYDREHCEMIQIGKSEKVEGFNPDYVLRGNCTLENYVKQKFLKT